MDERQVKNKKEDLCMKRGPHKTKNKKNCRKKKMKTKRRIKRRRRRRRRRIED